MPDVTVYEKNAEAGGNWRPNKATERSGSKDMFVGLWSNSFSHEIEFFDYTYDQHFETKAVSTFMPRAHYFDYMMARVTSVEDIFQHVEFNTKVTWVEYNDKIAKFIVTTKNKLTGKKNISLYDKCMWAGGVLSKPRYPKSTRRALEVVGDYRGTVVHSENIADFRSSIKGKRILLVGDNYSAEDIALQAIKMGVEHVYITSARGVGYAAKTIWPRNGATALTCLPTEVVHNGTGLKCSQVEFDYARKDYFPVHDGEYWELEDIALVVYCTGYKREMGYLDEELQYECSKEDFSVPDGWKSNRNSMTSSVGEVEPSASLGSFTACDNLYRHVLVANPNMMYIHMTTEYPISEIDAQAWSLAAYVAGETILPTYVEMTMRNQLDKLDMMSIPYIRNFLDDNYAEATMQFRSDSNHWLGARNYSAAHKRYLKEKIGYGLRKIARDQIAGGYGGEWGSYDKLSARGERLVEMYVNFEIAYEKTQIRFNKAPVNVTDWQTFRDVDHTPYESLYTGIKAVPLKGRWIDLGDDGELCVDPNLESDAPTSVLLTCLRTVSQRAAQLLSSVNFYWSFIRTSIG
jgi:hypothetical protein